MSIKVEYPNLQSRLLLKRNFEQQSAVPSRKPGPLSERFLEWYERSVLKVDTSEIVVDRPIYLMGLPRSGTTMLQDLFCAHPDLAYITNAMHAFRKGFCAVEDLRKRFNLDFKGERFLKDGVEISPGSPNEGHLFFAEWAGVDVYSLEFADIKLENFSPEHIEAGRETLRRVIWCFSHEDGKPKRFFNKNPGHITSFLSTCQMYPDAKIVHIIRDPRKCANSMLKLYRLNRAQEARLREKKGTKNGNARTFVPYPRIPKLTQYMELYGPDDIRTTANIWNDAITFVDERKQMVNHYYLIRYEDLLANPEEEMRKLFEFCELPEIADRNAEFWQKLSNVGVVKHKNEYGDFGIIEEICGDNMRKYGYL
jgi:hypothetical protein